MYAKRPAPYMARCFPLLWHALPKPFLAEQPSCPKIGPLVEVQIMMTQNVPRTIRIPAKRFRIGELVRCTPFSRQTIHNYTIMGLIREAEWTEGGHRLYDESVFERLARIMAMKETKTMAEIREILTKEDVTARAS